MQLFDKIRNWLRSVTGRMFGSAAGYSAASLPPSLLSSEMGAAIERWKALYYNQAPWLDKNSLSLGLPASIANLVATMVTLEAKITVTDSEGDDADDEVGDKELSPKAKLVNEAIQGVREDLQTHVEYACALGGLMFKPYLEANTKKVYVDVLMADEFYPTKVDAQNRIIGAVFFDHWKSGDKTFTRVEEHDYNPADRQCVIKNRAFESYKNGTGLGSEIPLASVGVWAHLEPETVIKDLNGPLFSYFKIPQGNTTDMRSCVGASVYARADSDGLLEEADKQWQRYMWEYEGGQMAIDASEDAFKKDKDGKPVLPEGRERLYRTNDLDLALTGSKEGVFSTFAPTLRDASYKSGMNDVLVKVENACLLARGSLADVDGQARTATELKHLKQRSYQLVTSTQMALKNALNGMVEAVDVLIVLYNLAAQGDYFVSYVWDDSIIIDAESERQRDLQEVREGLMAKWEYRKKWLGESTKKAKNMIAEIENRKLTPDELMGFSERKPKQEGDDGNGKEGNAEPADGRTVE